MQEPCDNPFFTGQIRGEKTNRNSVDYRFLIQIQFLEATLATSAAYKVGASNTSTDRKIS